MAMSIFRSIMNGIFGHTAKAEAPAPATGAAEAGSAPLSAAPDSAPDAAPAAAAATGRPVDVAAILDAKQSQAGQPLNWRQSIVDLMKLLNLDSGLAARKELAKELGYTGSTDDSAAMNIWLHKQVMAKLAENGGQVPADLKA